MEKIKQQLPAVEWLVDGWFSHCAQRYLQWQPTHWMPLPELPTGE